MRTVDVSNAAPLAEAICGTGLPGEMDRIDAEHRIGRAGLQSGPGQVADAELRSGAQPAGMRAGLAHRLGGEIHPTSRVPARPAISRP